MTGLGEDPDGAVVRRSLAAVRTCRRQQPFIAAIVMSVWCDRLDRFEVRDRPTGKEDARSVSRPKVKGCARSPCGRTHQSFALRDRQCATEAVRTFDFTSRARKGQTGPLRAGVSRRRVSDAKGHAPGARPRSTGAADAIRVRQHWRKDIAIFLACRARRRAFSRSDGAAPA